VKEELPEGVSLLDLGEHRLKDMHRPEQLHQLVIEGLRSEFPALTSLDARPNNLPIPPTPFVGRVEELTDLEELLTDPDKRLVSIVGAGGMGKSRLAIRLAAQQLMAMTSSNGKEEPRFPDGAFFVRLAPLESTEAILPTIAEAFGFTFYEGADPKQQILDFLRRKKLLLVMDNFEHLLEGAPLLAEILETAPEVRIFTTSREKLNLRGEVVYPLLGMRFPEEGEIEDRREVGRFSSIALFLQNVRQIHPDFEPESDELESIGRICRLVEGMPLGVELAATWIDMLSLEEIASEIDSSLDFLEAERRDAPERHHSLRAVFDYTWKLLSEGEQKALSRISVFRGGFTMEAAREVAGASLKQLQGLMNKSLLYRNEEGRFDIHELLRQYAEENLEPDEFEDVRNKHCDYYAEFIQQREIAITAGHLTEIRNDIDNIRASYQWAIIYRRLDSLQRSNFGFQIFYHLQGWYEEAQIIYEQIYQTLLPDFETGDISLIHGVVLCGLGWFQGITGDREEGLERIHQGKSIIRKYGSRKDIAKLNLVLWGSGDPTLSASERAQLMEENLAISEELGETWIRDNAIALLADTALDNNELSKAENLFQQAFIFSKESNNLRLLSASNLGMGRLAFLRGDYDTAKGYGEETLTYAQRIDYKLHVTYALELISDVLVVQEEYEEALRFLQGALEIVRDCGDRSREAGFLHGRGRVFYEIGDLDQAEDLFHESLRIYKEIESMWGIGIVNCDQGINALAKQNSRQASEKYYSAIEIGLDLKGGLKPWVLNYCIAHLAIIHAQAGEKIVAVELTAFTQDQPQLELYMRVKMTKLLAELRDDMPEEDFAAAQEHGQARELVATAEEMMGILKDGDLVDRVVRGMQG
jgi:predicted ATPase